VTHTSRRVLAAAALAACIATTAFAAAGPGQQAVLAHYAALAKAADPQFAGFSAARGQAFFLAHHDASPDAPSCSACHTSDPTRPGQTRAGKAIDPMAVSVTPDRFTDLAKVEKWFRRNCETVLGRECTPFEKGDFIAFMSAR
jgi:mono/diheme cytochrome c family protein